MIVKKIALNGRNKVNECFTLMVSGLDMEHR